LNGDARAYFRRQSVLHGGIGIDTVGRGGSGIRSEVGTVVVATTGGSGAGVKIVGAMRSGSPSTVGWKRRVRRETVSIR
jgi:hypothetical protein